MDSVRPIEPASRVGSRAQAAGTLDVRWLGRIPYLEAEALQRDLVEARRRDDAPDTLLLLEHPPVITVGRGGDLSHVLAGAADLERRGIELHECSRGGDVTFHGPGQLVGYPILRLGDGRRDAHRYLRDLEETIIRAVEEYGIRAGRISGLSGVWVGNEKLAALGVRLSSGWVTSHGFALNVADSLDGFSAIVPCGIHDRGVTSMGRLLGHDPGLEAVARRTAARLAEVFGLEPEGPWFPERR
jgi:lipoyl(octanoyl) transferase